VLSQASDAAPRHTRVAGPRQRTQEVRAHGQQAVRRGLALQRRGRLAAWPRRERQQDQQVQLRGVDLQRRPRVGRAGQRTPNAL
jgi:hypothetical protein